MNLITARWFAFLLVHDCRSPCSPLTGFLLDYGYRPELVAPVVECLMLSQQGGAAAAAGLHALMAPVPTRGPMGALPTPCPPPGPPPPGAVPRPASPWETAAAPPLTRVGSGMPRPASPWEAAASTPHAQQQAPLPPGQPPLWPGQQPMPPPPALLPTHAALPPRRPNGGGSSQQQWQGVLSKSGACVCTLACLTEGASGGGSPEEPYDWPPVLDVRMRVELRYVEQLYCSTPPGSRSVRWLQPVPPSLPGGEGDPARLPEFVSYLADKGRAGVIRLGEGDAGRTLYLIPPSRQTSVNMGLAWPPPQPQGHGGAGALIMAAVVPSAVLGVPR